MDTITHIQTEAPHVEQIEQFAKDARRTATPWRLWQYANGNSEWLTFSLPSPTWATTVKYRRHPHADLMLEWEKDQRENPEQVWQWRSQDESSSCRNWQDADGPFTFVERHDYRRKPRVCSINGIEFPEPLREAPAHGTRVWFPRTTVADSVGSNCWDNDEYDRRMLERGQYHLTSQAAQAHANAIIAATAVKGDA